MRVGESWPAQEIVAGGGGGSSRILRAWQLATRLCKAGGPSNFATRWSALARASLFVFDATKSVPPPPLRGAGASAGSPDSRAASRRREVVFDAEDDNRWRLT